MLWATTIQSHSTLHIQECAQSCHKYIPDLAAVLGHHRLSARPEASWLVTDATAMPGSTPQHRPAAMPGSTLQREIFNGADWARSFAATLHACRLLSDGVSIRLTPLDHVSAKCVIIEQIHPN